MTGDTHNTVGGGAHIENLTQAHTIENYTQITIAARESAAPVSVVPRQLAQPPRRWFGREHEERAVVNPLRARSGEGQGDRGGRCDIVSLVGPWGAGRTALAHRAAAQLAADDRNTAVVCFDLDRGRSGGVCDRERALEHLLGSFGVTREWLPVTVEERAGLFREITEHRRLILLLDNVRYGSEIHPLLPGVGDGVVMTVSQVRLHDLAGGPPDIRVQVKPLSETAALQMLAGLLDAEDTRLADEPEAARRLVRLCDRLPALIQTAAFCLGTHHRHTVAQLVDRLTRQWTEDGLPEANPVWDEGYAALGVPASKLYRLLAVTPALELPQEAVLALFGEDAETGLAALEKLENAGLTELGSGGRVRLHDHLRRHALRRARTDAEQDGTPGLAALREEAKAGRCRLVGWYLRQAQRASQQAGGPRLTIAPPRKAHPGHIDVHFETDAAARAWLAAERQILHACVKMAGEDGAFEAAASAEPQHGQTRYGSDGDAWALCEPLFADHLDHPHATGTADAFRHGLAAALRRQNLPAVVRLRCILARVLWDHEEFATAADEANAAVAAAELITSGDAGPTGQDAEERRRLHASALEFRGRAQAVQGRWEQAVPDYQESLRIHQEIDNPYGAMLLTYLLGEAAWGLGRVEQADTLLTAAHTAAKGQKNRERMTARTGFALAHVKRAAGLFDAAEELYEASLAAARARASTFDEVRVLDALAALADDRGATDAARAHRTQAEAIRRRETGVMTDTGDGSESRGARDASRADGA